MFPCSSSLTDKMYWKQIHIYLGDWKVSPSRRELMESKHRRTQRGVKKYSVRPDNKKLHRNHLSFWSTHQRLCKPASKSSGHKSPSWAHSQDFLPLVTELRLSSYWKKLESFMCVPTSLAQQGPPTLDNQMNFFHQVCHPTHLRQPNEFLPSGSLPTPSNLVSGSVTDFWAVQDNYKPGSPEPH